MLSIYPILGRTEPPNPVGTQREMRNPCISYTKKKKKKMDTEQRNPELFPR